MNLSKDSSSFSAFAPGRVNLIGEHTDYNGGFVLPTAIPQQTRIHLQRRTDDQVRITSSSQSEEGKTIHYRLGEEKCQHNWGDYVAGVTWALRNAGFQISGFDAELESDVPIGAGLSSSAALLVCVLRAMRDAFPVELDDVQIALLSQKIENEFVGANVGIMDQMASSLSDVDTALFFDTRDFVFERIALPHAVMDMFIIDSGIKHSHASGGYNSRRKECEEAARLLGVQTLREIQDVSRAKELPEPLAKRATHVISENARVLKAVEALKKQDMILLGKLMTESHVSLRDNFEVSTPEMDLLVESALQQKSVFGARMTGGGFGGSIVGICRPGSAKDTAEATVAAFQRKSSLHAKIIVPVTRS